MLSISHGMGVPSVGILLHEIIKLMYHAKCKDPIFIRIGTCGGVGVEGGTVCITEEAVDGLLRNTYELVGKWDCPATFSSYYMFFLSLILPVDSWQNSQPTGQTG